MSRQGWNLRTENRTGRHQYRDRPPGNNRTARLVWDHFARSGEIEYLELWEGRWRCQRPGMCGFEYAENADFNACERESHVRYRRAISCASRKIS